MKKGAKIFLLMLAASAWAGSARAGGEAVFTAACDTVDFGVIREVDGPRTVRFYMRNDGDTPSLLLKVKPTCGCTAADFRRDEVAPGDSAWIDLTYDPSRRPGRFEKGVKVYPASGEMIRIPIEGVVMASPETIASMFPVDAGPLHLSENTLMTLSPLGAEKRTLWLDVYNSGDTLVEIEPAVDSEALSAIPFPPVVPPGEKGMVGVYIDPLKETRSGKIEYTLTLTMNGEAYPIKIHTEKP